MNNNSPSHSEAVAAAIDVLDRHIAALNAGDAAALVQTLHFPHYRLAGGRIIWERPDTYCRTSAPAPAPTGTAAPGTFARRSRRGRTRYTSTCSSAAIAPTDRCSGRIAPSGWWRASTDAGPRSCARASRPEQKVRRRLRRRSVLRAPSLALCLRMFFSEIGSHPRVEPVEARGRHFSGARRFR